MGKKIGIDARLYSQTGVGVYTRNLLHHLQSIKTDFTFFVYVMDYEADTIPLPGKNFIKRPVPYKWHSLGEQLGFLNVLYKDNVDLMHFTYFSYPILYNRKFIATVHDLTPLLFKTGKASTQNPLLYEVKHAFFRLALSRQVHQAKKIITPTNTVKNQLITHYGRDFISKTIPIYEGLDYALENTQENVSLKDQFKKPFFLYVGNFYPHKNVERLIKAFLTVNKDYDLILKGPNNFFTEKIQQLIGELGLTERVRFYKKNSQKDLLFLYKHAVALVYPSLFEGFGLPIVEAAFCNLPIIASNIEVFKELLGDRYVSFDPKNEQDIAEKIEYFIREKPRHNTAPLLERFSFKKMTEEICKLYEAYA